MENLTNKASVPGYVPIVVLLLFLLSGCSFLRPVRDSYAVDEVTQKQTNAVALLRQSVSYSCVPDAGKSENKATLTPGATEKANPSVKSSQSPDAVASVPVAAQSSPNSGSTPTHPGAGQIVWEGCFTPPIAKEMQEVCKAQRNSMAWSLMIASDQACQYYVQGMYSNEATANVAAGTSAALFSGAAAVTTPLSASQILAALGGFSSAERSLFNEVVYKDRLITAISKKIGEGRKSAKGAFADSQTKSVGEYPLNAAMFDVLQYHHTCSFFYGLEKALEEGAQTSADLQKTKLERERNELVAYMSNRRIIDRAQGTSSSKDLDGVEKRLAIIDDAIAALTKAQTSNLTSSASKEGSADAKKVEPVVTQSGVTTTKETVTPNKDKTTKETKVTTNTTTTATEIKVPTPDQSKPVQAKDSVALAYCPAGSHVDYKAPPADESAPWPMPPNYGDNK